MLQLDCQAEWGLVPILPEEKLSNIVSGALDRLHYMTDACVKYDSEKKLWIYLHSDRNYEHPGWG